MQKSLDVCFSIVVYFFGFLLSSEGQNYLSFQRHHLASSFESNVQVGSILVMVQEIEKDKERKREKKEGKKEKHRMRASRG